MLIHEYVIIHRRLLVLKNQIMNESGHTHGEGGTAGVGSQRQSGQIRIGRP